MPRALARRWTQIRKFALSLKSSRGRQALMAGVAATGEHQPLLRRLAPATVIDIGANRGQFALDVEAVLPNARVHSFEPIPDAADIYRRIFEDNPRFTVEQVALGTSEGVAELHVSKHDDSSSLLTIGDDQVTLFPGTGESSRISVRTTTLDAALRGGGLASPVLMKIDVQGFELEVLRGSTETLTKINWVYVELSFLELYEGQPLAHQVIDWLRTHGFRLCGIGAVLVADNSIVQADFLFERTTDSAE